MSEDNTTEFAHAIEEEIVVQFADSTDFDVNESDENDDDAGDVGDADSGADFVADSAEEDSGDVDSVADDEDDDDDAEVETATAFDAAIPEVTDYLDVISTDSALALFALPTTGEPRVDDALGRLGDLESLPVHEHVEVFEDVQRRLHDTLADLAGS